MNCRFCGNILTHEFIDLGCAPPSNAYLTAADLNRPEVYYPLKLRVCTDCWLVQTEDYAGAEDLFLPDYAYFSSTSSTWLAHARQYSQIITRRLELNAKSFVVEIACNDGYLLKNFVEAGIPCLGIEPTASTAAAAQELGIPVLQEFFGQTLGSRLSDAGQKADLIIGNNVYAHVPDINDFTIGLKVLLKSGGTITLEFPHLMRLIEHTQFDTIYHEHFSYLSLYTVMHIFRKAGLRVFDVEELGTHGGSLRVYGCHQEDPRLDTEAISSLLEAENSFGMRNIIHYQSFQPRADNVKNSFLRFLLDQKAEGKTVGAYGAAAKGTTLLNYAGIKPDLLPYVVDRNPAKQGRFLPGSRIPIVSEDHIRERQPDFIVILPWNIKEEVMNQLAYIRERGGRFVTVVPKLEVS
ncbi:MAG: class I SAM-dependent methyltransferase [Desulfobacterium sp.]|nr:class I SAM-dependent methyltransferase [Desulfobacterium sp.]MBU3949774.1 class I SAM-dependent methyltransferase [Pseudomonadota bacterium]MBU4009613.1 class I SAM-dependent methyltransferase [Pseudomonadota bacterium]MBU4037323.1 class I SAM-dependent methyltransferase [Pseudomonadota bacterium]